MSRLFFFSLFLLVIVFWSSRPAGLALTAPLDVAALAAFKAAVTPSSIPAMSCLASWDFTDGGDPCAVPRRDQFTCGVTCLGAEPDRVVAITLDQAGYAGEILAPYLSGLTALAHLDLSGNNFSGPVAAVAFSSLTSLKTLALQSNSFSGSLDPLLFVNLTSLVSLDLSNNDISGEVPDNLGHLVSLQTLDLSSNHLSGELTGKFPPNLLELTLRANNLTGLLTKEVFQPLRNLEVLELAGNGFTGGVDGWLLQLPSLQQLDLTNNSLTLLNIADSGAAASQSTVVAVDLSFNNIEGTLPVDLAATTKFPALAALSLRHNKLTGEIPEGYEKFTRLFLDGNFLNGTVPQGVLGVTAGGFGDNCLEACPVTLPLCTPEQKPPSVCKEAN